jgi:hypothetical protein
LQALAPAENLRKKIEKKEGNDNYRANIKILTLGRFFLLSAVFPACAESFAGQDHFEVLLFYPALIGI